jgi:hypothetical protein
MGAPTWPWTYPPAAVSPSFFLQAVPLAAKTMAKPATRRVRRRSEIRDDIGVLLESRELRGSGGRGYTSRQVRVSISALSAGAGEALRGRVIGHTTLYMTLLGVVTLALSTGCSSGDDNYDEGGGELVIMPLSRDTTSNGFTIDTAELSFSSISLDPCLSDAALLRTRNFAIDLFHAPAPSVGFISSVTDFCGLTVELAPATSPDLPELYGATARFQGTTADATPFTLTSALVTTLSFGSDKPLDAMNLVLGVDLDAWFQHIDLTNVETSDAGLLVDADHNPDVLATFEQATSTAAALYDDADGDGALTAGELVPVATATQP